GCAGPSGRPPAPRRGEGEAQRREDAGARLGAGHPAALDADRVGGETEADRGDARERRAGRAVGHQLVGGIGEAPEPAEGALLELVEEALVLREQPIRGNRRRGARRRRKAAGGRKERSEESSEGDDLAAAW